MPKLLLVSLFKPRDRRHPAGQTQAEDSAFVRTPAARDRPIPPLPRRAAAAGAAPAQRLAMARQSHVAAGTVPLGPVLYNALPGPMRDEGDGPACSPRGDMSAYRSAFRPTPLQVHAVAVTDRIGAPPFKLDTGETRAADTMGAAVGVKPGAFAHALQPIRQSGSPTIAAAPVQRYRIAGDARVSEGDQLALIGERELYAGDAQFEQANALNGAVAFDRGPALADDRIPDLDADLHRVEARLKPNFSPERLPIIATDADGAIVDPNPERVRGDFDRANHPDRRRDVDEAARDEYATRDDAASGLSMFSDCAVAAQIITGQFSMAKPNGVEDMAAGSMYTYSSSAEAREWPFHAAGVIMTDGADHVTMENAAAKASQRFSKRQVDKGWWFDMFGPGEGQRFEDKYRESLPGGELKRRHLSPPEPEPVEMAPPEPVHAEPEPKLDVFEKLKRWFRK